MKTLKNINGEELSFYYRQIQEDNFCLIGSYKDISLKFLSNFIEDIYKLPFEEIKDKVVNQLGKEESESLEGKNENEFHRYICQDYFYLSDLPRDRFLKYFEEAKNDIKEIEGRIKKYQDKIKSLSKTEGGEKKKLQYFIAKNIEAKEEIHSFIVNDLAAYSFNQSSHLLGWLYNAMQRPYSYRSIFFGNYEYIMENLNYLSNKFQDMPIRKRKAYIELYESDRNKFITKADEYIQDRNVIKELSEKVDKNKWLKNRKLIIEQLLNNYLEGNYEIFCNSVPMQIEGILRDYCIELFNDGQTFEMEDLSNVLEAIKGRDPYFHYIEYYDFLFSKLRNKVAHGKMYEDDFKIWSIIFLLDLYDVCGRHFTDNLFINQIIGFMNSINLYDISFKDVSAYLYSLTLKELDIHSEDLQDLTSKITALNEKIFNDEYWEFIQNYKLGKSEILDNVFQVILLYMKKNIGGTRDYNSAIVKFKEVNPKKYDFKEVLDELTYHYG
jgi:hypothetical protein